MPVDRDPGIAAVHLGFHHGTGGVLLALAALALSRPQRSAALAGYLSLMLAYGLANALEDAWNEQLWKRGWVDHRSATCCGPTSRSAGSRSLAGGIAIYALWFRQTRMSAVTQPP